MKYKDKQVERWANQTDSGQNNLAPSDNRWKLRSTTYQGIADAMAAQWGIPNMSAKTILCECPICEKEFMARADQLRSAVSSGREVPCCSNKCERERRYGDSRDLKWMAQQQKSVDGLPKR